MQITPFSWLPLSVFGGAMDGLAFPLAKYKGMPYVIMLFIGVGWLTLPLMYMAGGEVWQNIGLASAMSFSQIASIGPFTLLMTVLVGLIFWSENIARFDAISKAPYVGYVLMVLGTSEDALVFAIEPLIKKWQGELVVVRWFEVVAILFALSSAMLHYLADKRRKASVGTGHFTRFGWVPLAAFAGVIAGLGQLVAKSTGQAGVSPVTFVGVVGLVWVACSVAFIAAGPLWGRFRFPPTTTMREVVQTGRGTIALMLLVGWMTAAGNIAKFDAIMYKAPLIGFVLVVAPVSVFVTSFFLEFSIRVYKRLRYHEGSLDVDRNDVFGVVSAFVALSLFQLPVIEKFLGF